MGLRGQKSGRKFGTVSNASVKPYTPEYFAHLIIRACRELGMTATVKLVSEGLGTIDAEGGFTPANWNTQRAKGPWGEEPEFPGTESEHLDPYKSTYLAIKDRKENGSFYSSWWKWEEQQGELETGQQRAHKFIRIAEAAGARGSNPSLGEEVPVLGGLIGDAEGIVGGAVEGTVGAALSAGEFLSELAQTVLNFQKLGSLAASAFAWFLRLVLKAIWDFVIQPLVHWAERAETFYYRNFFGTGVEKGSGFGYQLRQNAGIITIGFWALGYAVLWSDGSNLRPVEAHESMFGRTVKVTEGKIARRNLIKPSDVDRETPDKPKEVKSSVTIERTKELSVNRKRPVTVGVPGGTEDLTGRNPNERRIGRVSRTGEEIPKQTNADAAEIVRVPERRTKVKVRPEKEQAKVTTPVSGSGASSRTDRSDHPGGNSGAGDA